MEWFFEMLKTYFPQVLAVVGTASVSVTGVVAFIKSFFESRKTIKKLSAHVDEKIKEALDSEQLKEVMTKIETVIEENKLLKEAVAEIKSALSQNLSVEMRAYIETILGQKGNESLALAYENIKSQLIEGAKTAINEAAVEHKDEVVETLEAVEETATEVAETAEAVKNKASKAKEKVVSEVDYV